MSYARLEQHHRQLGHLRHLHAILHWDEAVMMPPAAGPARSEATATLVSLLHRMRSELAIGDWLREAEAETDLDAWQRANVREMRRDFVRATAVPAELVEASTRTNMRCEQAWRRLRGENDWLGFRPLLEEVVDLTRQRAAALGDALGLPPYDALMDHYEPGFRAETIDTLFASLREFLPAFTREVLERRPPPPDPIGRVSTATQQRLARRLMGLVGFDMNHGRLDISHHPFCGGVPGDVRITTRYDEQDFAKSLMATLHETGHAKYEQGLPAAWHGQPVGRARSMAVHESQSLLQEMQVSRSREFMEFAAPIIAEELGAEVSDTAAFDPDNLVRLQTRVQPGAIRVDADEVTYPAHILLRYDIERRLIDGSMSVSDIPEVWDAAMGELLQVDTSGNHADGCMQDVHWAAGAFGYFPAYTLGALIAAQLFAAARAAHPRVVPDMARGDFAVLDGWLHEHVWSRASSVPTPELIQDATGVPLSVDAFLDHLQSRYGR